MYKESIDKRENILNRPSTRWIYYRGVVMCMADWGKTLGISPKTLDSRINRSGWSVQRSLTTPVRGKTNVII